METAGSPKFPGNPRDHSPCSPTPVGPSRLSRPWVSCLARPPRLTRTRAHHEEISGLNRTAFDLAVYASSWRLPAIMQDSLPAAGPALPGGIGYPQGSCERFHGCNDSPFPSFLARCQLRSLVASWMAGDAASCWATTRLRVPRIRSRDSTVKPSQSWRILGTLSRVVAQQ